MTPLKLAVAIASALSAFSNAATLVSEKSGPLRDGTVSLPGRSEAASLLVYLDEPSRLTAGVSVRVTILVSGRTLVSKPLHEGDWDLYAPVRTGGQPVELRFAVEGAVPAGIRYVARLTGLPPDAGVELEPNDGWQDAHSFPLGSPVFASGDETSYIPVQGEKPAPSEDWYRFEFSGSPRLAYFWIDLIDRDNIPADVSIYRERDGKAVPYTEGEDPVALPHEVQALPGNKFTTRLLKEPGNYYVRVVANHPEYRLRTSTYDAPPYSDPRKAVRSALDFLLGAGDSWHANTPRRGGVFDRVASNHQETSLCVACHPTHFSQRAQLYAARNQYPVHMREQLQFLSERFYNNPRPLYGFEREGAVWARVISAPANVLGRMSHLMDVFEREVSGERRTAFHDGVRKYLELYYTGREKLPADETNGNSPLVSAHEVAWYAWEVTRDPALPGLIAAGDVKNMIDLCYQTQALAAIDRSAYADQIAANAERILKLQRPSGQWAMRFEAGQPEVEFQTGHALWALHAAGIPVDHPQVRKSIDYLLSRQQTFGGWMDPLQSGENFRTPFRETQMAVLALSSYFPEQERKKGWNSAAPEKLPADTGALLRALHGTWDRPGPEMLADIESLTKSPETMVRQAAVETLGRTASTRSLQMLTRALGDESKLVRRTAAWAVRQVYSRTASQPEPLLAALNSKNARVRWGATRVFANHFSALANDRRYAGALVARSGDAAPAVAIQAIKGLWQFWYWSPDSEARGEIEDALLGRLDTATHPWVERNAREGIYNIADENIRYLYNNWVPALARAEDREKVIRGRLALEDRLATKFAAVLEKGKPETQKRLLSALAEFPLRRSDVYDPKADLSKPAPPVYNRIGNDIEQTVFFGESNARVATAILPLMKSSDHDTRRLAQAASVVVRDGRFASVSAVAGPRPAGDSAYSQVVAELEAQKNEGAAAEALKAFRPPQRATGPSKPGSRPGAAARPKPDEGYFRGYVQPIFETRGKDGYACVHCHSTHTLFNGSYSTVMGVVDLDEPENSLVLRKPTSSAETEGTLGATSHGGGVRFEKDSPEYNTILNWIRGAKP